MGNIVYVVPWFTHVEGMGDVLHICSCDVASLVVPQKVAEAPA